VLDAALRVPVAPDRLVALLVLIVQIIFARFAAIHTVKAHAVEVSQCVETAFRTMVSQSIPRQRLHFGVYA
jgi:hypothetical protein